VAVRTALVRNCFAILSGLAVAAPLSAGQIEAVRGKSYRLTRQHGPWMIMVGSFRDVGDEDRKTEGLSAQEAADEVVYELRKKGVPAYTFSQNAQKGEIKTVDRSGRDDLRIYAAQRDMICVIAGNYESQDSNIAERTLKHIKRFTPEFMTDKKSGAIYRKYENKKGPFGSAFLTINPLLDPTEIAHRKPDVDLVKLNYGIQNALVENPKKYTVQVATFSGRSVTPIGNSSLANREEEFDFRLHSSRDEETGMKRANLGAISEDAAQLAAALRKFRSENAPEGFQAWVYHDRFESIVTVGGFENPNDPRIAKIIEIFGAKMTKDKVTGQEVLVGEVLTPDQSQVSRTRRAPTAVWVFDPQPRLIEVPHLKASKNSRKS
jgi:hypothetical protein